MPHVDGDDYTYDAPAYDCRTLTEKVAGLESDHVTAWLQASQRIADLEAKVEYQARRIDELERRLRGRGPVA